jgi:hypothetical protein
MRATHEDYGANSVPHFALRKARISAQLLRGGVPTIAPSVTRAPVNPSAARASMTMSVLASISPSPSASRQPRPTVAVNAVGPPVNVPPADSVQVTVAILVPTVVPVICTGKLTDWLAGSANGKLGAGLNAKSAAWVPPIEQFVAWPSSTEVLLSTTLAVSDGVLIVTPPNDKLLV